MDKKLKAFEGEITIEWKRLHGYGDRWMHGAKHTTTDVRVPVL